MIDVEREFVTLSAAIGDAGERQLLTRTVGTKGISVGLDVHGGKHVLIPCLPGFEPDTRSRGVHLVEQRLVHQTETHTYADLRLVDPKLDMVFDRLAQDVVASTESSNAAPLAVCKHVLEQWRDMLRRGDELTTDEVIGLAGELFVLEKLANYNAVGALGAWVGPRHTVHDFVTGGRAIEVKSTASLEGTSVTIHGLDQLDPAFVDELYLAVVHLRASETAPSLDDRIRSLILLGVPREPLLKALARAGYTYESRPSISTRYRVANFNLWKIGSNFPGLRRSALPEHIRKGISNVRYTLSTDSAPKALSSDDSEALLEGWFVRE